MHSLESVINISNFFLEFFSFYSKSQNLNSENLKKHTWLLLILPSSEEQKYKIQSILRIFCPQMILPLNA